MGAIVNKRSKLFKELSNNEMNSLISNNFTSNTEIIESKLLVGGLFNTTYFFQLAKPSKKIVCRLSPINSELLYNFEKCMMSHEQKLYELLESNEIPVPQFIGYDASRDFINREYTLTEFIPSKPMNDVTDLDEDSRKKLLIKVGKIAKKMHSIKSDYYGYPCLNDQKKHESWYDFLVSFLDEILERAEKYNLYNQSQITRIENLFTNNKTIFQYDDCGSLIHNDLWAGNILISKKRGCWDIDAIIDIDRALFGDYEFEFSAPWLICSELLEGYGIQLKDDNESKYKRDAYYLIIQLMCADVWLTQYDNPENYNKLKKEILEKLEKM